MTPDTERALLLQMQAQTSLLQVIADFHSTIKTDRATRDVTPKLRKALEEHSPKAARLLASSFEGGGK